MWDAVPDDLGPRLFAFHREGESTPEGFLQPGQKSPRPLAVRKEGFKLPSFERFSWKWMIPLVEQRAGNNSHKV